MTKAKPDNNEKSLYEESRNSGHRKPYIKPMIVAEDVFQTYQGACVSVLLGCGGELPRSAE